VVAAASSEGAMVEARQSRVGKKGNVKLVSRRVGNSLFSVQKQCRQALSTRVETDRLEVVCTRVGYVRKWSVVH